MAPKRSGLTAGGTWIVDRIKTIDAFPQEDHLATILSETRGGGGGAHNVIIDLALMEAPFPLRGQGVVGTDEEGKWLIQEAYKLGIDVGGLRTTKEQQTSYTDVYVTKSTGRRTFFHNRGANRLLEDRDLDPGLSKIFHLANLTLLDRIDFSAARTLQRLRSSGIKTSVDVASAGKARLHEVVVPALEHIDYLILNEVEAGDCAEMAIRRGDGTLDKDALAAAARKLRRDNLVIVHQPEGAFAISGEGELWVPSKPVPKIVSALGAGDAFCAGVLYGLHEEWPILQCLDLGHLAASACLAHETTTGGLRPVSEL
ncbi:MAG: carbohydrate kinase family protein [Planctomycetaceae bacterium]|nr:carbohydrate kinase family protein [Planctomycetaceae bacterium]